MTKIYLVVFESKENGIYDATVFTNKRKAMQYKRYWDAKIKLDHWFKDNRCYMVEKQIFNWDMTKEANNLEMELLPY